jgi:hypothetical protein
VIDGRERVHDVVLAEDLQTQRHPALVVVAHHDRGHRAGGGHLDVFGAHLGARAASEPAHGDVGDAATSAMAATRASSAFSTATPPGRTA